MKRILIPLERSCNTLKGAKNAFNANFKFKAIDGKIVRKSDLEDGCEVTIIFGTGKISFTSRRTNS